MRYDAMRCRSVGRSAALGQSAVGASVDRSVVSDVDRAGTRVAPNIFAGRNAGEVVFELTIHRPTTAAVPPSLIPPPGHSVSHPSIGFNSISLSCFGHDAAGREGRGVASVVGTM